MKWRLKWREFTHGSGQSRQCWAVALGVDYVAICTGCPGQKQQTRMYWFQDTEKAETWLEKQIEGKMKKGYVETNPRRRKTAIPRQVKSIAETTIHKNPMSDAWKPIEAWFAAHTPDGSILLSPGASLVEIKATEKEIGEKLPSEVRHSYLIHNGSSKTAFSFGRLLSIDEVGNVWTGFQRSQELGLYEGRGSTPPPPIKPVWYNPQWIPIASNDEGEFVVLDLDPARQGKKGQLIAFSRRNGATHVLANTFRAFLKGLAKDLQSGKYILDKKRWILKPAK